MTETATTQTPAAPADPAAQLEGTLGNIIEEMSGLKTEHNRLHQQVTDLRRSKTLAGSTTRRNFGSVSDHCARMLAAQFILHCEKSGKLGALTTVPNQSESLLAFARSELGLTTRTALTTSDIPLPSEYGSEIRELISDFGVVRRKMMPYPIGMGTARPPRMGTRPAFASIAMSGSVPEKSPTLSFASLESHKIGGIVRLPREIDEQSIVSMGQFLARYGAVEFARAEDTWGFLADGTGTYESVKGIVKTARDNSNTVVLGPKPSRATPRWLTSAICGRR